MVINNCYQLIAFQGKEHQLRSVLNREKNMSRGFCYFTIMLLFSFLLPTLSKAVEDPVMKAINEAVQYYQDGRYTTAVTSLDSASQMIRLKKDETLGILLPEPLDGWSVVIGNNLLITLEGTNIKRDDLMAYAGKVDIDTLARLP
jgi:hypothetical protein